MRSKLHFSWLPLHPKEELARSCCERCEALAVHGVLVWDSRQDTELRAVRSWRTKLLMKEANGSCFLSAFVFSKQINLNASVTSGWFLGNLFFFFFLESSIFFVFCHGVKNYCNLPVFFLIWEVTVFDIFHQAVISGGTGIECMTFQLLFTV